MDPVFPNSIYELDKLIVFHLRDDLSNFFSVSLVSRAAHRAVSDIFNQCFNYHHPSLANFTDRVQIFPILNKYHSALCWKVACCFLAKKNTNTCKIPVSFCWSALPIYIQDLHVEKEGLEKELQSFCGETRADNVMERLGKLDQHLSPIADINRKIAIVRVFSKTTIKEYNEAFIASDEDLLFIKDFINKHISNLTNEYFRTLAAERALQELNTLKECLSLMDEMQNDPQEFNAANLVRIRELVNASGYTLLAYVWKTLYMQCAQGVLEEEWAEKHFPEFLPQLHDILIRVVGSLEGMMADMLENPGPLYESLPCQELLQVDYRHYLVSTINTRDASAEEQS